MAYSTAWLDSVDELFDSVSREERASGVKFTRRTITAGFGSDGKICTAVVFVVARPHNITYSQWLSPEKFGLAMSPKMCAKGTGSFTYIY